MKPSKAGLPGHVVDASTQRLTIIRAGALAAIAGGALRATASFAPVVVGSDLWRESLYVVIDFCLAAGLLAFYSRRSKSLGPWGPSGLVVALVGIATIRMNRLLSAGDLYPVGALAIACGVMILTIRAWIAKEIHGLVLTAFAFSTPPQKVTRRLIPGCQRIGLSPRKRGDAAVESSSRAIQWTRNCGTTLR